MEFSYFLFLYLLITFPVRLLIGYLNRFAFNKEVVQEVNGRIPFTLHLQLNNGDTMTEKCYSAPDKLVRAYTPRYIAEFQQVEFIDDFNVMYKEVKKCDSI